MAVGKKRQQDSADKDTWATWECPTCKNPTWANWGSKNARRKCAKCGCKKSYALATSPTSQQSQPTNSVKARLDEVAAHLKQVVDNEALSVDRLDSGDAVTAIYQLLAEEVLGYNTRVYPVVIISWVHLVNFENFESRKLLLEVHERL